MDSAAFYVCFLIGMVLFSGEPSLLDALVSTLDASACSP